MCVALTGIGTGSARGEGDPNRHQRELRLEQLLAALERRVGRMVVEQSLINKGMEALVEVVERRPDQKPRDEDKPAARRLADGMAALSRETAALVRILQDEGTSVAFPEVFMQLRDDMDGLERRFRQLNFDAASRLLAQDILATLREMISAMTRRCRHG